MAKKVLTTIKLQAPGGQASPAPPVGPALGQHGINIMEFVKAFNAQTSNDMGVTIPAGGGADPPGDRDREGLGRAEPDKGRDDHPGPGPPDRREEAGRPQRAR